MYWYVKYHILLNMSAAAATGSFHVFTPTITAPVSSVYLCLCATTPLTANATAGRFTVILEYTLY